VVALALELHTRNRHPHSHDQKFDPSRKILMRNLFATILLIFLAGCASTKGYSGATLPDGEVAKIYASKAVKTPHGKQTVLIGEANGKVVGGGAKGYPEFVAVPPGEANIKYKIHTRSLGRWPGRGHSDGSE
jgi:hypothetical protein